MPYSRQHILERLRAVRSSGYAMIAVSPCNGLVAKCAARAGADLIVCSSINITRSMGFPTRIIDDFRGDRTLTMYEEFEQVVGDVPIVVGLDAADIRSLNHERLLDRVEMAGASGVANVPTVQMFGDPYRNRARGTRRGFEAEVDLLKRAHRRGMFTIGYVYYLADAEAMLEAGVDVIVATSGHTSGGRNGYPTIAYPEFVEQLQPIVDTARRLRPEVFRLAHGGPLTSPQTLRNLTTEIPVDGLLAGSIIDRLPIEQAVEDVLVAYKRPFSELRAVAR